MKWLASTPRWVLLACAGLVFVTWLDVLDLIETLVLLEHGGYAEANPIASASGAAFLAVVKLLVPIIIGVLLLLTYRSSVRLFRLVALVLWLAILPYAYVVAHNLQLLWTR